MSAELIPFASHFAPLNHYYSCITTTFTAAIELNPFAIWTIAYGPIFREVLSDHGERLCGAEVLPSVPVGSVEDALVFLQGTGFADTVSFLLKIIPNLLPNLILTILR